MHSLTVGAVLRGWRQAASGVRSSHLGQSAASHDDQQGRNKYIDIGRHACVGQPTSCMHARPYDYSATANITVFACWLIAALGDGPQSTRFEQLDARVDTCVLGS